MKDETGNQRWGTGWALPVSVGLHLLVAALLLFELPSPLAAPQEEEPVEVELVPPPEAAKPEPPPAPAAAEKPAEPEKPEETAAKPPEAAEPPEAAAQPPEATPPAAQKAQPPQPPVLNPVVQFGETDAGPRQALGGDSAEEGAEAPPTEPARAEETPEPPAEPENEAAAGQEDPPPEEAEETGELVSLPEISAIVPAPPPARSADAPSRPPLQEAQRLFSQSATGAQVATTAIGNIPREARAGRLCTTELREQLRAGSPPYFPDLLPTYPLEEGNVLDVPTSAFRVRGQWVDLSFRCTVDSQATRVVSFAHRVGRAIPRSQWARRELPGG